MERRFRFVEIEHIVDGNTTEPALGTRDCFATLDGRFSYRAMLGPQRPSSDEGFFVGDEPETIRMRRLWAQNARDNAFVPCGQVTFEDMFTLGDLALPIDMQREIALVGAPINWDKGFARWYVEALAQKTDRVRLLGEDEFSVSFDAADAVEQPAPGIIFVSPGEDIYGHWIIDYAPRMFLAKHFSSAWWRYAFFRSVPAWAVEFLRAFDVDKGLVRSIAGATILRFPLAAVPSGIKQGFRINQPANADAWRHLNAYFEQARRNAAPSQDLPSGERLFISRAGWGAGRGISNSEKLEEIAVARGYVSITPEKFSVVDQSRIFLNARIVVGEDGSGLHNVVFAQPGCVLGVVASPVRPNLWHAAICQAMGLKLSYFAAAAQPDQTIAADESRFDNFLSALEAEAAF